jgi:3-oxoacyl-[acyl-carrier-protein] synthase II
VTTVGQLLLECGLELSTDPELAALVLGTASGSVQSMMDFTKDSFTGDQPYHVDPARFPNAVMNRAAGQCAIWHGIKGPNTTIAGGALTGLLALSYGVRLYRSGRADRVLCGAAEEYSVQRAWLEWHNASGDLPADPLGEGSAVFLLESATDADRAGRNPLARMLTTRFRAYGDRPDARQALADCVRGALEHLGATGADIRTVAPMDGPGVLGDVERDALGDVLGQLRPDVVRSRSLLGDTSGASASFQIAATLVDWAQHPAGRDDLALVTGVDRDGSVGCALLGGTGELVTARDRDIAVLNGPTRG